MIQSSKPSYIFFLIAGACLITAAFLFWQRNTPRRLAFNINQLTDKQQTSNKDLLPTALIIKDLNIELPIYPAVLENGRWPTTAQGISYLVDSAIPGQTGNSILYGHNWPNLLSKLVLAQKDQKIEIKQTNGEIKHFVIAETMIVTPDQTHVLSSSSDTRLTIYTCTGFLDRKRFIVTAVPR